MKIIINNETKIDVPNHLIVKDDKLYNTKTKSYEAVDGDIVTLKKKEGDKYTNIVRGYVDGYTDGNIVKIRGRAFQYTNVDAKEIDHISKVKEVEEQKKKEITVKTVYC